MPKLNENSKLGSILIILQRLMDEELSKWHAVLFLNKVLPEKGKALPNICPPYPWLPVSNTKDEGITSNMGPLKVQALYWELNALAWLAAVTFPENFQPQRPRNNVVSYNITITFSCIMSGEWSLGCACACPHASKYLSKLEAKNMYCSLGLIHKAFQ